MAIMNMRFHPGGWINVDLNSLEKEAVADERSALVVKLRGRDPTDRQLDMAARICLLGRKKKFREIVYVPGTRQGLAEDVPVLAQIVPRGNPRLTAKIEGPKLTFTAPDNSPQKRKPRKVPMPRLAEESHGPGYKERRGRGG